MTVKFPDVTVKLLGQDGNAMSIMARVNRELHRGGATKEERDEFMNEAMSGDYDNVLQTVMRWVNVE